MLHDREMKTIMNIDNLKNITQMEEFLEGSQAIAFAVAANADERYLFIGKVLKRFSYTRLKRKEKGVVIKFLMKISGYSRQQITRLITQYSNSNTIVRQQRTENGFKRRYTPEDIRLLAEIDELHETPNGLRVKKICERAYQQFNNESYKRLSNISVAHIYNLRQTKAYQRSNKNYTKTKSKRGVTIGQRRKPKANGNPGYIRIDTVHQGDLDKVKGVYHINAVDEVTQYEVVVTVEKISEHYLIPALQILLAAFPFKIINFHSDNGSEYVNVKVAKLLQKLLIEFTKSRPRHCNDNALAEGKNAAVVRKIFGYSHIPQKHAQSINEFNVDALNPYINFHRPCLFPTTYINKVGKERKKYEYENMQTPYEKFKSLPNAQIYLKEGINFKKLDDIANAMTDNEAAEYLQQQRLLLFKMIHEDSARCA
jgi:DNA-binding transcriptional MerR regulator